MHRVQAVTRYAGRLTHAMAPKRKLEEIGGVVEESGAFRVRMWLDGRNVDGPRRGNQQRALGDLSTIRTAAAEHATRARQQCRRRPRV